MSYPEPRTRLTRWGSPHLLGLLVVLAFLGHDVTMAAPRQALATIRPALTPGLDSVEASAAAPHLHGCRVHQTVLLKTQHSLQEAR